LDGSAVERIEKQLPLLFAAVENAAREILSANSAWYSSEPPTIRLVSSFAEGTDQIAVAACPADWQVEAVLPFPIDEYSKDFASSAPDGQTSPRDLFARSIKRATAVTQLPFTPLGRAETVIGGDSGRREQGYANAGAYLLRQIDVLVAVWDGRAPKTGGTGALAKQAYDEGIPVVWLSTLGDPSPRLIAAFDNSKPVQGAADCTRGPLLHALMPIFSVSDAPHAGHAKASMLTRPNRFFQERWHTRSYLPVFDFFKQLATPRPPRLAIQFRGFSDRRMDWDRFIDAAPETGTLDRGDLRTKLKLILLERFIWADSLADYYAHSYRSAYVAAYLFSAAAVFIALGSAAAATPHASGFALLELATVVAVLLVILIGRWCRWHERWIEYRALAESLRHGRFLAFVSEFGRIHESSSSWNARPIPWTLWYVRATMREIGLPTATLDHTYQWRLLQATLQHEIEGPDGQIAYHEKNHAVMHRLDHAFHVIGLLCFGATFFLLCFSILQAIGWVAIHWEIRPSLTFWTAGLPALGAALAGIRVQGDFEGSQERSARMLDVLGALQGDYTKAITRNLSLRETSDLLIATAHAMSEDVAAWQELYGRKWLSLPG
jgi:hypothetical protein